MIHNTQEKREVPPRRVGTFTCGLALVSGGLWMLTAMFRPELDLLWAVRLAPLALVSLGAEVLLAARGWRKLRYDWAGILLTLLVGSAVLCLCAGGWWLLYGPGRCR